MTMQPEINEDENPTLLGQVVALRGELAMARRKELAFRVFVLLVILGGLFLYGGLRSATNDIVETRTESRAATCRSDNRFITNHNILVDAVEQASALVAQPNPMRTPEQQAAATAFVEEYVAKVEVARVALRDCSPEAIKQFYEGGK